MRISVVDWTHRFLEQSIKPGDTCIDATVGNGGDLVFLAGLVGEQGQVHGFDIQEIALENTKKRLQQSGFTGELHLDSHANMDQYFVRESVQGIVFNLGYLPGGDHRLATKAESTVKAIGISLDLLKKGGVISLCIYSGGDSGFEEKEAILAYLKTLDCKKYLVITNEFYNMPNHPPMPVFIIKK